MQAPRSNPYFKILSQCDSPNCKLRPNVHHIYSVSRYPQCTSQHATFFTSLYFTMFPAYLHYKDERALPGYLHSSNLFSLSSNSMEQRPSWEDKFPFQPTTTTTTTTNKCSASHYFPSSYLFSLFFSPQKVKNGTNWRCFVDLLPDLFPVLSVPFLGGWVGPRDCITCSRDYRNT
jgi:hypothetical protein